MRFEVKDSVETIYGGHGIIMSILSPTRCSVGFANGSCLDFSEKELKVETKEDVVNEIMTLLKNDRLNPISKIDRSYVRGWVECEYYRETITLDQKDELLKKWGIE